MWVYSAVVCRGVCVCVWFCALKSISLLEGELTRKQSATTATGTALRVLGAVYQTLLREPGSAATAALDGEQVYNALMYICMCRYIPFMYNHPKQQKNTHTYIYLKKHAHTHLHFNHLIPTN